MVPPRRVALLRSWLPIWALMAHSRPDSASCRARAPSDRFLEICGSTAPSDMKVMVRSVKTISKIIARGNATPRSSRIQLKTRFMPTSRS